MDKVTVRIWMPGEGLGAKGKFATWAGVGHAALTVRVGKHRHYITWMAQGSPFIGDKKPFKKLGNVWGKSDDKKAMAGWFLPRDEEGEGPEEMEPTYKIKLKTKQPGSQGEGLDAQKIEDFWLRRCANMPNYNMISLRSNCTGCVAEALKAGGLEQYVPAPKNWIVQDAASLLAWCLAAEQRFRGGPAGWGIFAPKSTV
jgi:hypothetical protein